VVLGNLRGVVRRVAVDDENVLDADVVEAVDDVADGPGFVRVGTRAHTSS